MKAYWKDVFREIKNTLGRFLSLLIITALGAASVVGILSASVDMRDIADKTYKERQLYDVQIKSTVGFDADDGDALRGTPGVSAVMLTTMLDAYTEVRGSVCAVRAYALPDGMNTVVLRRGRLPENANECVIEQRLARDGALADGSVLTLGLDDADDYFDMFGTDKFTIVGVVDSPLYTTMERGNTTLGDGTLEYYIYLHPDAFTLEVYTDAYIRMDGSAEIYNLSDEYDDAAKDWRGIIEETGKTQVALMKQELADAQAEIYDGWAEYYDGVQELEEKSADGRRELADAKEKLDTAKYDLEDGQRTLDAKIELGLREIEDKTREIADGQAEIDARYAELADGQSQLDEARAELNANLALLESIAPQGLSAQLDAQYAQVYAALEMVDAQQAELDAGKAALDSAQAELDDGARRIAEARGELETERVKAQTQIDEGWAEYESGLEEYYDGVDTLDSEVREAQLKLDDAERELKDAQEKLDDAPEPEWFYFTRKDGGVSFDSYYQDTLRLQKIGYVFPMVFFLVAILVSLTSMSRMVEEHRTQQGIYKALGYRPAAIRFKYILYAFLASFTGGVLGVYSGSNLFPRVISEAYGHLYDMPPVSTPVIPLYGTIAVTAAVASVVAVTFITCVTATAGVPAQLMRPKAPPIGKRVLLERAPIIWNRFSFIGKVTARNIFRYKKRFIMTLIGVAGCSALLVTAFGLRDSVGGVSKLQYEHIVKYDARVYLKDITTEKQRIALDALFPADHLYIREETADASGANGAGLPTSIIIPEYPDELARYIDLRTPDGEAVTLGTAGVLVTDKLARVMGVTVGGEFTLTTGDGKKVTVRAAGIVENYVLHNVYMPPDVYRELFGTEPKPNGAIYFGGGENRTELLDNGDVRAVIDTSILLSRLSESTDALSVVTVVLIVLACALALVVLFNLTNINISERLRELATIKVLGFQDGETAMYVYRENAAVTLMGIVLGLFGGILLHRFVLNSVEIDLLKFPMLVYPQSYIYAVLLSAVFAAFVNWVMNFKLKKIDMVESLKNIE